MPNLVTHIPQTHTCARVPGLCVESHLLSDSGRGHCIHRVLRGVCQGHGAVRINIFPPSFADPFIVVQVTGAVNTRVTRPHCYTDTRR